MANDRPQHQWKIKWTKNDKKGKDKVMERTNMDKLS
jgi:hypothetical protein